MNANHIEKNHAAKSAASACIASCQKLAAQFERARRNLLAELRSAFDLPEGLFRSALGEAEALAFQTGYPHLLFPALAREKVQSAAGWNARQQLIRQKKSVYAMSR